MRALSRAALFVYDYFVVYFNIVSLGVQCLAWTPCALILHLLLPESRARILGRQFLMVAFRGYLGGLALSQRLSFDLTELDALRTAPSTIIAPNHPCLLDALMVISRLPNVACILKTNLLNNVFLGAGARLARFIPNEPVRTMVHRAVDDIRCGNHLLLFPEGTRTTTNPVNQLKGSIGIIARRAQVPVQTVLIETDSKFLSKGWPLFRKPVLPIHYRIRLGKRFDPPQNAQQFMAELDHYFRHELVQGSAFYDRDAMPDQADRQRDIASPS